MAAIWHFVQIVGWTMVIAVLVVTLIMAQRRFNLWGHEGVRVGSGIVGIWLLIYMLLPVWWSDRWWENGMYLMPTLLIIWLGASMMPAPAVPIEHRIGKVIVVLGTIVLLSLIALKSDYAHKTFEDWRTSLKSWTWSSKDDSVQEAKRIMGRAAGGGNKTQRQATSSMSVAETQARVMEFWYGASELTPDAQRTFIEIATEETHFRQFNADGSVYKGEIDSDDTCVMQVNVRENKSDLESWGLDVSTLNGCLEASRKLYGKYGFKPWKRTLDKINRNPGIVTRIDVPKIGRSERFVPPKGKSCQGYTNVPVSVYGSVEPSRPYRMTPTSTPTIPSEWYEYESLGSDPAIVTITCR